MEKNCIEHKITDEIRWKQATTTAITTIVAAVRRKEKKKTHGKEESKQDKESEIVGEVARWRK